MAASIKQQLERVEGMLGSRDLSEWETRFISDITEKVRSYGNTTILTSGQVEKLQQVHDKHFA